MPFLNFVGNKNKHFNLSDMNFFMKNMKNRYSDPDPDPLLPNVDPRIRIHYYGKVDQRIRIHYSQMWIPGFGYTSKRDGSATLLGNDILKIKMHRLLSCFSRMLPNMLEASKSCPSTTSTRQSLTIRYQASYFHIFDELAVALPLDVFVEVGGGVHDYKSN